MLREFGFRNYYGFREGVTISLALGANCPSQISQGRPFTTIMGVKGANASGKTTILRGMSFLSVFASRSFGYEPDGPIPLAVHFFTKKPCDLYAEFEVKGVVYIYEVALTERRVVSEVLYRKKLKKSKIIERKENTLVFTTAEFEGLKLMHLRSNASLISTAKQYGMPGLGDVFEFFASVVSNVSYTGHVYEGANNVAIAEELHHSEEKRAFVVDFLKSIDVGVTGLVIHESVSPDPADPTKEKKSYTPFFEHGGTDLPAKVFRAITWHTESNGTRALFNRLPKIKRVLDGGGVLIADEFDLHLHPNILPLLLNLFIDDKTNPHQAQLIFTTHDGDVLDFIGKYRCYIVNKRDNESFAYRLDEIPGDVIRNDRPISPVYRAGKIGGIPRV